jgi:hypothetical protein
MVSPFLDLLEVILMYEDDVLMLGDDGLAFCITSLFARAATKKDLWTIVQRSEKTS